MIYKTCEFYIHSVKYMSSNNWVALQKIKWGWRLFQALKIFWKLEIEGDIHSKGIFVDKKSYGKVKYSIF